MSQELVIRSCVSQAEVEMSLKLASVVFRGKANEHNVKANLIVFNREISPEYVVGIFNDIEIVGCCFLVPKYFFKNRLSHPYFFLSSVCVRQEYRGLELGKKLVKFAIIQAKKQGAFKILTIARKSADYFYQKLGFSGGSTYPRLMLEHSECKSNDNYTFRKKTTHDLNFLNDCYENSYRKVGYFKRNQDDWERVLWKLKLFKFDFRSIEFKQEVIGYLIMKEKNLIELAVSRKHYTKDLLSKVLNLFDGKLTFKCNHFHPIFSLIGEYDYTYINRSCAYGGHMSKNLLSSFRDKTNTGTSTDIVQDFNAKEYFFISELDEI